MSIESKNIVVDIEGEMFSLVEVPHAGSRLVERSKENLLGSLDLASVLNDIGKLGNFIRIAYNGVARSTALQIKVQRVGYKITKLADKSAVTVQSFKNASRTVLQELQGTNEFLLDGLEEMALETLSLLSTVVDNMAKAAEELHEDFNEAGKNVIEALEDVQVLIEAGGTTRKYYDQAQQHEDKALCGDILKVIGNIMSSFVAAKGDLHQTAQMLENIVDNSAYQEAEKNANNVFACVPALKSLSAIMVNTALFWRRMQKHCETLAKDGVKRLVEMAMKSPEENRIKVWTSTSFKRKAVVHYSQWVALHDVCGGYAYSREESREKVRTLAESLARLKAGARGDCCCGYKGKKEKLTR